MLVLQLLKVDDAMAYDNELLNLAYARTGISPASLVYDLELSSFINLFFQEISRLGIHLNVYGGTPLNRGFFGEKQRLSLDLDLAMPSSRRLNADIINVRDVIKSIGYKEVRHKLLEEGFAAYVSRGESIIKIEMRKRELAAKTQYITLHPVLEYYGLATVATRVPSYEFEYLLASKLHAFARRMIYRDLYDSFMGLQVAKDTGKLVKYVKLLDKKRKTDAFSEIIGRIGSEDYAYKQSGDTVYEELVPLHYREDRKVMASFVMTKLKSIQKHRE